MVWTIVLWVILIHLFELVGIGFVLLIRKNNKLEKIINSQSNFINTVAYKVQEASSRLDELDVTGAFKSDDEVGYFFKNLKEIHEDINEFINKII